METKEKKIIWTSEIDVDAWREDIKEWYPSEYEDEELTDEYVYEMATRENNDTLSDVIEYEFNKDIGKPIVIIANLGLWNGRRRAWKLLNSTNLKDIFSFCEDRPTWYVEDGEIKCDDIHHDGTNHYTYRAIKDDISDWEFEEMMYEGKNVDELTEKLGHYVAEIYGWEE